MKISFNFSKDEIGKSLEEKRDYIVPILAIAASVILFLLLILPQILAFPSKKSLRDTEITKLNELKNAKVVLEKADTDTIDGQVNSAEKALPSEKNFELILNAISSAAAESNTIISGYIFSEGSEAATEPGQNQINRVMFEIDIIGSVDQAVEFIDKLYQTFPVSEVRSIEYSSDISKIMVYFYYKPFTSAGSANAFIPKDLNSKEQAALNEISSWSDNIVEPIFQIENGSSESGIIEEITP